LAQVLDDLGLGAVFSQRHALLKVNLMRGCEPALARTTHPAFLQAVLRLVRSQGGTAVVAESSGVLGFTGEVAEAAGIAQVCREEGAELVSLDAGPFRRVDVVGDVVDEVLLSEALFDCDLRVTLPKLKTHTLITLTAALKNQVGCLPGASKCQLHERAPTPALLGQAIAELAKALPFQLGLVDAVLGLEGGGSGAGRPVRAGFVAGSTDLVALDAVAGILVGVAPNEVPSTVAAAELGLGNAFPERIELLGLDRLEPLLCFRRSAFDAKRMAPVARRAYRWRGRILRPWVNRERCERCGGCADICPQRCIRLDPWPTILQEICVRCFACRERCPHDAMLLECPFYLRPLLRRRTRGLALRHLRAMWR